MKSKPKYRKPTTEPQLLQASTGQGKTYISPSKLVYFKWVRWDDSPYPLHKWENDKHFVFHTVWELYSDQAKPSEPYWQQISEDEAKALVPEAFKA